MKLASIKYLQQLTYFFFLCEFSIISSINLRNDINKSGIIKAKLTLYQERCPRSQSSDWNKSWWDLATLGHTDHDLFQSSDWDLGHIYRYKVNIAIILTRISRFTPNKSGIGISVLVIQSLFYIHHFQVWLGRGWQRYRNDFSENHFFKLWPLTNRPPHHR